MVLVLAIGLCNPIAVPNNKTTRAQELRKISAQLQAESEQLRKASQKVVKNQFAPKATHEHVNQDAADAQR